MTLTPLRGVELARFRSGDPDYFQALVGQYGAAVKGVALSFARDDDDLQDLFQEIWLRIYAKRGDYRGAGPVLAWILTIARRLCVSRARNRNADARALGRLQSRCPEGWPEGHHSPPDPAQAAEDRARLAAALRHLTSRQRLAVVMRLYYGFSAEEAADVMGCAPATVRSLMRNGLINLRRLYGEP